MFWEAMSRSSGMKGFHSSWHPATNLVLLSGDELGPTSWPGMLRSKQRALEGTNRSVQLADQHAEFLKMFSKA